MHGASGAAKTEVIAARCKGLPGLGSGRRSLGSLSCIGIEGKVFQEWVWKVWSILEPLWPCTCTVLPVLCEC